MGFIFFGGYNFLKEADQFTNAQLAETISLDVKVEQMEEIIKVDGTWNWNETPQDIIIGDDYIGITVIDHNHDAVDIDVTNAELKLMQNDEVIFETKGEKRGLGYIFEFPNKLDEQKLFGFQGEFSITFANQSFDANQVVVGYLHTWADHGGLISDDTRFLKIEFNENIQDAYWVIERFNSLKEE